LAILEAVRSALSVLPVLAKMAIAVALVLAVPRIAKRYKLPPEVGLILSGVVFGPHVLDLFGEHRPIVEFFGDLGKLLLMFFAGLEIDLALFRKTRARSVIFGVLTTTLPLLFGTVVGHWLGYGPVPAIVIGSLLASHTLLGNAIVRRLGATNLEPITITIGATVLSDTLSLIGTGFFIDPPLFVQSIIDNFPAVVGIITALLVGKWIAAQVAGGLFHYSSAARMTMWSLTLPQVAATLAATLVAFHTLNPAGERLLDDRMLNVVLVLVLTTSILGPLLTQRFAPRLVAEHPEDQVAAKAVA